MTREVLERAVGELKKEHAFEEVGVEVYAMEDT